LPDFLAMNVDFTSGELAVPIDLARERDFRLGRYLVRPSSCELEAHESISVEPRVMQALVALAQRKGAVVSRDELVQRCWSGRIVGDDAINRCIAKVRKLAGLDAGGSFAVETMARIGYRLTETKHPAEPEIPATSIEDSVPLLETGHAAVRARRYARAFMGAALLLALLIVAGTFAWQRLPTTIRMQVALRPVIVASRSSDLPAGAVFKDCADGCPDMVVVPAGYFGMGARPSENALAARIDPAFRNDADPQHEVLIRRKFAIGRYDVTRAEYARFATETARPDGASCETLTQNGIFVETVGASWRRPGFPQTSRDPVVCISWYDAAAYADWLGRKTSLPYRLPTEAEWEIAARADGASSATSASLPSCGAFNGADADYHAAFPGDRLADLACRDGYAATSPVGSFPANGFGLFDMLGNAAQWVSDCYHRTYDGAPADGSAWTSSDCTERVVRGGYWALDVQFIRIPLRGSGDPKSRFSANGFRVARAM
jgi:sulfatase modifying factor 1